MIWIIRHYSILNLKPVMEDPTLLSCCNVLPIMLYYLANFYFTYYDINPKTLYHNKHSSVFQSCSRLWRTPLNNFKRLQCTTLSFFVFLIMISIRRTWYHNGHFSVLKSWNQLWGTRASVRFFWMLQCPANYFGFWVQSSNIRSK